VISRRAIATRRSRLGEYLQPLAWMNATDSSSDNPVGSAQAGWPSRQWDRRGARPASEWGRPSPGLVLPVGLLCQDVDLRDWQLGFATQFAHGVAGGQA
jgi:hypothetical protein